MSDPRALAEAAGLTIEFADLGAWPGARLISEYDGDARAIRINERALEAYRTARGGLDSCARRTFIDLAIAHELHHHREAVGDAPIGRDRRSREAAADAFARRLVRVDGDLDAFLRGAAPEKDAAHARR